MLVVLMLVLVLVLVLMHWCLHASIGEIAVARAVVQGLLRHLGLSL
jgi:hypothetical protein